VRDFTSTRRKNPCQICGDIKGKCRETPSIRLCMTFADALQPIPGFDFIGRTKDDLWGKWIETSDVTWTDQERDRWRQEQRHKRQQRTDAEAQRRAASLDARERDRYNRQLLNSLTLHTLDRADLHQRGISDEQIAAWGVKSVAQWQTLDHEFPHTLSGVSLTGDSLNAPGSGYLCPIQDVEGFLVGFQIRLRDGDLRYLWLTSATKKRPNGPTPHLPNGELPLAVHRPKQMLKRGIAFVEGVGAKPFITAQRQGQITIGAAGGQFASSPKTLKASLDCLSIELDTKTIDFYPDAGAIHNRHVMRQYRATWKLLRTWGYAVRVAWWGQETKAAADIDELEDSSPISWLTTAQVEALAHPRLDWLEQIKKRLQQKSKPVDSAAALRVTLDESQIHEYAAGDRLSVWRTAIAQGYRYVLDNSPPGGGKSYDAGNVEPKTFQSNQIIYLSDQHRNPTVATLDIANGWVDLEARHGGLVREATPGGGMRLKRSRKGEALSIAANCNRNQVIAVLRAKHVNGADTASTICSTCPLREPCTHSEGSGYGFLNQRRSALSSPKLRAHLDSLPDPKDYSLSDTILLIDEPGQNFQSKQDIQITLSDLEQTILKLVGHSQLFEAVQPLLVALLPYLDKTEKIGKFGINHLELVQKLPTPIVDLKALDQALIPDLSFLNTTAEHGVDLADLPRQLRKKFSERDAQTAEHAGERVVKQWLSSFIQTLMEEIPGASMRIGHQGITLTLPDPRHRAIAQAAKAVIFLDGTLHPIDLALKLRCKPEEIFVCRQATPKQRNLKITQVTDLGRMGMQRGADQQKRAASIVAHYLQVDPMTKVIDFKKFVEEGMGAWWRDSRGTNDFEQVSRLILIGTPCRNLADLQAEYTLLAGVYPNEKDLEFRAFIDRAILADIHQAIGRLRAHRRLDESLEIILLNDFPLDIPTHKVKALEITLEAANKWERFVLAVKAAIESLNSAGEKVTQTSIAAISGYQQQYLSRHWKLLQTLLGFPNSKSGKELEPQSDALILSFAAGLDSAISYCKTSNQILETIDEFFFEWLKSSWWKQFWWQLKAETQVRILEALVLLLPSTQLLPLFVDK
jgi:hypothetical protein